MSAGADKTSNPTPAPNIQPQLAKVTLKDGTLTVEANNSDLTQILREIAAASGMTIDGSIKNVRVYGVYGPDSSRSILTALLQGLGYNFMMSGATHNGAPRELTLTPQSGASSIPAAAAAPNPQNSHSETEGEEVPGRGAVVDAPPPPPDDIQERMQQHLQHLEQMHNPQASQNQPQ